MANADPHDAAALSAQVAECAALGCDIFRLTVPDVEAAKTLGEVRRRSPIPLVADIHFDYRCALAAMEAGADALRINPGNIGSRDRVEAVVRAAKEKKVPIRVGVNLGSLEKGLRGELDAGAIDVPEALVRSALGHLKILEDEGFRDVVISAKASNVPDTIATYRFLAERTDCPLHVGVTEAGTLIPGAVRNSVADTRLAHGEAGEGGARRDGDTPRARAARARSGDNVVPHLRAHEGRPDARRLPG